MLGQLPLDSANEVVGVFKKHFTIDRLGRTQQRVEDGRALDMAKDGEASYEARAQGYVRPRGVDAQVKEETNAVLPDMHP